MTTPSPQALGLGVGSDHGEDIFHTAIIFCGYAETSSIVIITTKDAKKEGQYALSFLCDLRVFRGEIT